MSSMLKWGDMVTSGSGSGTTAAAAAAAAATATAAATAAVAATAAAAASAEPVYDGHEEVVGTDEAGVTTVIQYRVNTETGRREKVTRRFKRTVVATVPECVHAHNEWVPSAVKPGSTPFGKAAESNAGCTMKPEDDLHFEKVVVAEAAEAAAEEAEVEPKEPHSIIKCSRCGMEGHFSLKCPLRDVVSVPPGGPTGPPVDVPDKEVPEGEKRRLYVTNIAPGVEEEEVRAIFVPYGRVFKCYLKEPKHASDVYTATVTFSTHEEAKRAMEELNGCGFRSMRLHIEWKKEKKDGGGGGRRRRRPCQQPLRVRLRQGAAAKPRHRPQVASPGGHRGDRRGGGDEGPLRGCDALPCDPSRRRT